MIELVMSLLLAACCGGATTTPDPTEFLALPAGDLAHRMSVQGTDGNINLLIVTGLSGEEARKQIFHEWAVALILAAEESLDVPPDRIVYLAEEVAIDPARIDGRSTAENIEATLRDLAERVAPADRLAIVLIGHGSARGGESRINLPGPDLTAADFARLLDLFPTQAVAVVNTTSASGDFVAALSAPNRAIITATRDGRQNNATVFARYFVAAYGEDLADLDKDERVSLLEAYEYAVREVQRFYESEGRMLTETALLDDNGDGEGSHEPGPDSSDGLLARRFFLNGDRRAAATASSPDTPTTDDPELRALYERKQALEQRIEELRRIKETMDPEVYMTELESLLVDLALTEREIRDRGGAARGGTR
jgi:hypothetical protein